MKSKKVDYLKSPQEYLKVRRRGKVRGFT